MEHSFKNKISEIRTSPFSITPSPLKNRPHNAYTKEVKNLQDIKAHT